MRIGLFQNIQWPEPTDQRVQYDNALRQTLLSMRSEAERLRQLSDFLPEFVARTKRVMHVRKVAPRNGHGFVTMGPDD